MMNPLSEMTNDLDSGNSPDVAPSHETVGHDIKSIEINLNVIKTFFVNTIALYEKLIGKCCKSCRTIESIEFVNLHKNLIEFEDIFKVFDVSFNKTLLKNYVKKSKEETGKNVARENETSLEMIAEEACCPKIPCFINACTQFYSTEEGAKIHFIKSHCKKGDMFDMAPHDRALDASLIDLSRLTRDDEGKYNCPIGDCSYSSIDRSNFKVHIKRHANNPKFECVCGKKFFTRDPLMIHFVRVHMKEVDWELANSDIRTLRKTIRRLINREYFSLESNEEMADSDTDLNGPIDDENNELNDYITDAISNASTAPSNHMVSEDDSATVNVSADQFTPQTTTSVNQLNSFNVSLNLKDDSYFTDSVTLKTDGVIEEVDLIELANEPSKTMALPKTKNKATEVVNKEIPQRNRNYKCPHKFCNQEFFTSKNLLIHLKASHDPDNPIPCTEPGCTSRFKSIALLAQHQKRHNVNYSCELCPYKTHLAALMTRHNRQHAGQPLCHECEVCHEKFEYLGALRTHLQKVHHEFIKCEWLGCNKRFKTIVGLKKHAREFHCNMRSEMPCEWPGCEAVFSNRTAMNNHMRIHTNERPFQCTWQDCGKWFRLKETLKRHLKLHQGYRPHLCPFDNCNLSFLTKRNLKSHMERGHLHSRSGKNSPGKDELRDDEQVTAKTRTGDP